MHTFIKDIDPKHHLKASIPSIVLKMTLYQCIQLNYENNQNRLKDLIDQYWNLN